MEVEEDAALVGSRVALEAGVSDAEARNDTHFATFHCISGGRAEYSRIQAARAAK
jgi:hypothetical protein